jgi:hypothetical protein
LFFSLVFLRRYCIVFSLIYGFSDFQFGIFTSSLYCLFVDLRGF